MRGPRSRLLDATLTLVGGLAFYAAVFLLWPFDQLPGVWVWVGIPVIALVLGYALVRVVDQLASDLESEAGRVLRRVRGRRNGRLNPDRTAHPRGES